MTEETSGRGPAPRYIGPFKILDELGRGGQAVVYLAQDGAGERVAIKCVSGDAARDPASVRRLAREGEFLAVLDHPNIARVYSPLVEEDRLYMVMEYVQGQPLTERLRFGPLPPNDGLAICRQIALAIEAAHRARVIHRDLKPANIRITPDGTVKVLDFGVAAYAMAPSGGSEPAQGDGEAVSERGIVGTYGYMAPEQMMGGEVSFQADIWSFGCILFECLVGHPLFAGASFHDVFMRVACRDADLGRLPQDVPRSLRAVLKQCLVRHPQSRLSSISEVIGVIDTILSRRLPSAQRPGGLSNLPRPSGTFVGREREMAEITSLLRFHKGVCITGTGGAGKTRLAIETASRLSREFRHGVWFVDFSDRSGSESVAQAITEALAGAPLPKRARAAVATSDGSDESRVAEQLAGARLLLVLDQCDLHVEALRRMCAAIHERCPNVRVLMTSREHPGIEGHGVCPLSPLPVPASGAGEASPERLRRNESVRLFVERARQVDRGYAPDDAEMTDIAELCRRLEGLPLSVELAGARAGTMRPAEMSKRLDFVLREPPESALADASRRPRHSTLSACIKWSFDLLSTQERHILTRLSVFKGGWTLEAAEAVCAVDAEITAGEVRMLLARLVNKSLITYDAQAGRYSMLESVKEFAGQHMGAEERRSMRTAHFEYFRGFTLRTEKQILGREQTVGMRAVHADLENITAALDAVDLSDVPPEAFLEMAAALARFWYVRGHFQEARRRLASALARAPEASSFLRAKATNALGTIAYGIDDLASAEAAYRESLEIALSTGDRRTAARAWDNIALVCGDQNRNEEADQAFEAALQLNRELGDHDGTMRVTLNRTYYQIRQGMLDRAEASCNECLEAFRRIGDRKRESIALHNLGEISYFRHELAAAHEFFVQSLRIKDQLGDRRGVSLTLYMFALVLLEQGDGARAAMLLAKSLEIRAELGIAELPMPREKHDGFLATLTQRLGPAEFAEAWARGRELYDEEAIQTVTNIGSLEE